MPRAQGCAGAANVQGRTYAAGAFREGAEYYAGSIRQDYLPRPCGRDAQERRMCRDAPMPFLKKRKA